MTRLETFIKANRINRAKLAKESRYTRQHLFRLRHGIAEPTRPCMIDIARAASVVLGREVKVEELFEVGPDVPAPHADPPRLAILHRYSAFVVVTEGGSKVYVNADHVSRIRAVGDGTAIEMDDGVTVLASEEPALILARLHRTMSVTLELAPRHFRNRIEP